MKRHEAKAIIDALVMLRESATNKQALSVPVLYPTWREDVEYVEGERVLRDGTLYRVLMAHTSQADWKPEASPSLFAQVLIPDSDIIHEWVQPESTNGYSEGDKVTHNGKTWVSTINNNVWEPSVYGWDEAE